MILIVAPMFFIVLGFTFFYLSEVMPIFRMVFFQWFALIFFVAATVFIFYRIYVSRSWKQVDNNPRWRHLINYRRRDNEIVPIYGDRAYPGESFLDVPKLGLIEFLGKDCFYNWGDKKVLDGLENINFTTDPRYYNLTHLFYEIGFTDSVDISNVLNGHDLELMGRVFLKMQEYDNNHGAKKLVKELKDYGGKTISFKPSGKTVMDHGAIAKFVDKIKTIKKE